MQGRKAFDVLARSQSRQILLQDDDKKRPSNKNTNRKQGQQAACTTEPAQEADRGLSASLSGPRPVAASLQEVWFFRVAQPRLEALEALSACLEALVVLTLAVQLCSQAAPVSALAQAQS